MPEEKIEWRRNLRVYWQLLKRYKWLFILTLFVIFLVEMTLVAEKYLFKLIVDNGTEWAADKLEMSTYIKIILAVMIAYVLMALLRTVLKYAQLQMINLMDSRIIKDLKLKFFNHILHLDYDFHTSHKTGSLISRLIRGASAIERMTDVWVFQAAPLVFQLAGVVGGLLLFSVTPALIALLTVLAFVAFSVFIQYFQQSYFIRMNNAEDIEKANISDVFTNIETVKYFGKERRISRIYDKLATKTKRTQRAGWKWFSYQDAGQSLILSVGSFFIVYYPLMQFLDGAITLGSLVFIYTVYTNLFGPLFGFVWGIRNLYNSMTDIQSLFQYLKEEAKVTDKPGAKPIKIKKGQIELKDVHFKYHKRSIFKHFELKIRPNEKVALVGPSGGGKSSLVKLIFRLYDVQRGQVLIDGKDLRDVQKESLRAEIAIVPQECILFDDTIYNNIKFSNPGAKRKDVMKAMKFAQLDKIIKNFPKRENTIVGERGVKLSGGEKQRVSIARAILADKKILVLDEATSALDSETEHEIQKDLQKLMKGRTSIVIAHRLSTIMHADRILVLADGKIVQQGKHSQLIKKKGMYKRLWNLQKGGYID